MTAEQLIQFIYRTKEHDTEYPSSSDDDYTLYLALIGDAVRLWETEKGIRWNELWTTLTDAATGDKTVVADTLDYDMPTDFRALGAWVRTTTSSGSHTFYKVITAAEAEGHKGTSEPYAYVTGNVATGFTLHFGQQPTAGDTINYPYYKAASVPDDGADVIEMSDPLFCAFYGLSTVDEENMGKWLSMANERMKAMKYANADMPYGQPNDIPDIDLENGMAGFGE